MREQAEVYVINPDTPRDAAEVLRKTGLTLPLLLDPSYAVARQFDLPKSGRPMNGLVGFVVIDPKGIIRFQRVDLQFGTHVEQILAIARTVNGKSK